MDPNCFCKFEQDGFFLILGAISSTADQDYAPYYQDICESGFHVKREYHAW